jgi:Ni,Fe-hydrogenase III small subunit/NAD-dependent dihydropyrimidine dehydrogenase PreA subunit
VFRFDASGCNGCDVEIVEILALLPGADLGFSIAERPEEANVLVVTGGANVKSKAALLEAYAALREPRVAVAVGSCAASMGIFKGGYSMAGPIDAIIPIDLYIAGCPPRPQAILAALAETLHLPVAGLQAILPTPDGFRGDPHVDPTKCIGCSACANVCPADAIEVQDAGGARTVRFMRHACIFCASCQDVCPTTAVELRPGDAGWFREKGASKSEATLPLAACALCGGGFMPESQIEWALKTVIEKRAPAPAERAALRARLRICAACRRGRISDVREAKRLLVTLERSAGSRTSRGEWEG